MVLGFCGWKDFSGGQEYVMSDEAVFVKVVSAQTILRTADPTAQVVAGTLTLTGMLFEATFEERFPGEATPAGTLRPTIPAPTAQTINGFVYPDTELRSAFSQKTFFCLPVHERIWRHTYFLRGLMLERGDGAKSTFSRVGFWSIVVSNVEKHSRVFGVIVEPFGKVGQVDQTVEQQTIAII
jgi:hypothetical protein